MAEYLDQLIIYFFLYSFLGYLCEVFYCSVGQRRLVNRGFLYGPYLPIYGFGSLIIVLFLSPVQRWPLLVFLLAILFTSALEYFASWLLEKLFSVKRWDYSSYKFNLNGRVCLKNSLLFGIMGLLVEYGVQPLFSKIAGKVPAELSHYIAEVILIVFAVDTTLSVVKMLDFKKGVERLKALSQDLEAQAETLKGLDNQELAEELRARMEKLNKDFSDKFYKSVEHLVKANPSMTAKDEEVRAQLEAVRRYYDERKALYKKLKADLKASKKNLENELKSIKENDK